MGKVKNALKKVHLACKKIKVSARFKMGDHVTIKGRGNKVYEILDTSMIDDMKAFNLYDIEKDDVLDEPMYEHELLPANSNNQQLEKIENLITEHTVEDIDERVVEEVNETVTASNISGRTEIHFFVPAQDYDDNYDPNIDSILEDFGLEADMADVYENFKEDKEYGEGYEVIIPVSKDDDKFLDKFTEALEEIGAVGVQIVKP